MRYAGYTVYDMTSMAQFTFGTILLVSMLLFIFHLYLTSRMAFWDPLDGTKNNKAATKRLAIPMVCSLIMALVIPLYVCSTSDKLKTALISNETEYVRFPWNYVIPAQGWLTDGGYSIQAKAWGATLLLDAGLGFIFFLITGIVFLIFKKALRR